MSALTAHTTLPTALELPPTTLLIPAADFILRPGGDRGGADHGWLKTRHSFSFASYQDPAHMGFRALRVINEDRVRAGQGFPMHGHRDMEIVTWVLEGALEHRDSLGNGSIIRPGDAQRMSAGTGIRHSEFEPTRTSSVHFLQIWLLPNRAGHAAGYEQRHVARDGKRLQLIASPDGARQSIRLNQDTRLYVARLNAGKQTSLELPKGRHAWLQITRGGARVNGIRCAQGDGIRTSSSGRIEVEGIGDAEVLIFDLA